MSSYIKCSKCNRISIHALREESDMLLHSIRCLYGRFQSTLSVRRATDTGEVAIDLGTLNFNPRSP